MNIIMAGIDHSIATIAEREMFAHTKSAQGKLLNEIITYKNVAGCVMINTCNRTELWISYEKEDCRSAYDILCDVKGIDPKQYAHLFHSRKGSEAVNHLFEVASGLKSRVFGEEQIISQVKDAISFARDCKVSDPVLETLFRNAVTAAKKVKSTVRLRTVDHSVAKDAVEYLCGMIHEMQGVSCVVIGNGEMGKLAAKHLVEKGCEVKMTLRQYKHGDAIIPFGCNVIAYESRYEHLHDAKIIISATTSPHFTIDYDPFVEQSEGKHHYLFDLAVPRDIDPKIKTINEVDLFDVDDLGVQKMDDSLNEQIKLAYVILSEYQRTFEEWYYIRNHIPKINEISSMAAVDVVNRAKHGVRKLPIEKEQHDQIFDCVNQAAQKVIEKIIFGMKKSMKDDLWFETIKHLNDDVNGQ